MLKLDHLGFGYRSKQQQVVSDFSAQLKPGKVTAILGPNAAGKTTLLKLMLGLLEPQTGSVIWQPTGQTQTDSSQVQASLQVQKQVQNLPPQWRAKHMAYVPQHGQAVFGFTAGQVVAMADAASAMGGVLSGLDPARQQLLEKQVLQVMQQFDVADLAKQAFSELSGGQKQRVTLARAFLQRLGGISGREPGVLLLDEPVSAMDLKHAHKAMQMLVEQAQAGDAVGVVLHDLTLASRYADEIWLVDGGRLIASGTAEDVLVPEVLEPVYQVGLRQIQDESGTVFVAEVGA